MAILASSDWDSFQAALWCLRQGVLVGAAAALAISPWELATLRLAQGERNNG